MNKLKIPLLSLLLLLVSVAGVEAQVIQLFVVPVETVGTARGPQYLRWRFDPDPENSIASTRWSCKDNGLTPVMICAVDADQAELDILAAKVDVYAIPANIDTGPTAQELSAFESYIEARAIPGQFNPATPWREILREVLGGFFANQKYQRITGEALEQSGIQLNTQLQNMPAYVQTALGQIAAEFRAENDGLGYDWTEIKATDNTRAILKWFQAQWGVKPIFFGFFTL